MSILKSAPVAPKKWWCEDLETELPEHGPLSVFEPDERPSGLLDAKGRRLVRRRQKIGFLAL